MFIIKHKTIFLLISALFVLSSIVGVVVFGFKVGIDFKGGTQAEVAYINEMPEIKEIQEKVDSLNFGYSLIQPIGEKSIYVKTKDLSEDQRQTLISALKFEDKYEIEERSFTSIGPSVGKELKNKSIISLSLVAIMIILFIAYAFRKVSKPVSSWKYGIIAIITLLHDVILTIGVFALLSHFTSVEADTLFVVALLTVLGLSVNDTIVVFDRVRENLQRKISDNFEEIVGKSLNQTLIRSLNTSLSTIVVLLALFFVGPESTKVFALILASGMFFGAYSSLFVASPLLVIANNLQKNNKT